MNPTVAKLKSNMGFVALIYQIFGLLYCITIIGAIVGWPYYLIGKYLKKAITQLSEIEKFEDERIETAIHYIDRSFRIVKIIMIIGFIVGIFYFIFIFAYLMPMIKSGNPPFKYS